jgi:hypothetical protein
MAKISLRLILHDKKFYKNNHKNYQWFLSNVALNIGSYQVDRTQYTATLYTSLQTVWKYDSLQTNP